MTGHGDKLWYPGIHIAIMQRFNIIKFIINNLLLNASGRPLKQTNEIKWNMGYIFISVFIYWKALGS